MNYEEIEPYLIDYIRGNLDESIEYRVKAYIKENPDFQKEIDELKDTLDFMHEAPLYEPEPGLKMEFYAMLNAYQPEAETEKDSFWTKLIQLLQSHKVVAWSSLIVVIFLAGYFTSNLINQSVEGQAESTMAADQPDEKPNIALQPPVKNDMERLDSSGESPAQEGEEFALSQRETREPSAYSDYESEDNELAISVAPPALSDDISTTMGQRARSGEGITRSSDLQSELESDERIQYIYSGLQQNNREDIIIQALIRTLNTDPNPNVRIAAIDALEKFAGKNQVKELIAQSLDNQSAATVQLATIDLIVKYRIKEGAPSLKKLLYQPGLNQTVRQQAEIALNIIS